MFEYAILFYNNHELLFYLFLIIAVIIEWPITILALSLVAVNLWISFLVVFIFSFIWEFIWDILHYIIWRFFKTNIFKNKKFSLLEKIEKKLEKHSLFDKLIVIKYTPPITSIWLLYMWYNKINLLKFIKNISVFAIINWLIITSIWYNFWYFFKDKVDMNYLIITLFLSFLIFYFLVKYITKYIIKKIYGQNT